MWCHLQDRPDNAQAAGLVADRGRPLPASRPHVTKLPDWGRDGSWQKVVCRRLGSHAGGGGGGSPWKRWRWPWARVCGCGRGVVGRGRRALSRRRPWRPFRSGSAHCGTKRKCGELLAPHDQKKWEQKLGHSNCQGDGGVTGARGVAATVRFGVFSSGGLARALGAPGYRPYVSFAHGASCDRSLFGICPNQAVT